MKTNFKRNLLIGFSVSMIILIVTSAASYVSISNLLTSARLVNQTNTLIIDLNSLVTALVDAETGQRGFLLVGEEEFLDPYNDSRDRTYKAFSRVKEKFTADQQQQERLHELGKFIEQRYYYLDVGIRAIREGKEINADHLRTGKLIMDKVRGLAQEMQRHERELLLRRTESMDAFAMYTPPLILAAAFVALLITVSFYIRVRNDFEERAKLQHELEKKDQEISARIDIIRDIADKVAQGRYDIRVNDQQSDALGSVAGALNRMAESLQYSFNSLSEKEWLQTGLAKLNDTMIGEKEAETLSAQVIEFLAGYTGSNVGAIYLLEGNELRAAGGYAFVPDKSRKHIRINDGILGQCIATRKPVELKGIPSENISIRFATGEAKPSHVVAVPIFDGYAIKGALEVATIGIYSQLHIDFLMACTPNIGIAISMAQNRSKVQELLEETQSQAEELKAQHSELENLNGELEVQAEKLQASEEELKVQQEELRQANQELEERSRLLEEKNQVITERNIDIQQKADQLAQSTKYKSEFLANMSHELRTPLNSILLLSRLMAENTERNLTPDQTEYARVIQSSGQGLLSLIDEILDLSKIEAGKMKLEFQTVNLKEVVNDVRTLFKPMAEDKHIEFRTTVDDNVPESIETDKLRLEQIIRNLLSNAIKFTSNGFVHLNIATDKSHGFIRISVKDTGIGIPKDKQLQIFEAFQQADGSTRRKYGGTGLGLSISRELVKLLGGDITLVSEPGEGSEFSITVPIKKHKLNERLAEEKKAETTPQATSVDARERSLPKKYISTVIPDSVPDDRGSVNGSAGIILIIEDDVNFARSLMDFTRKKGYKAIHSTRGDEGIELAKKYLPAGILLDIQLPVKSGWEVMEELKQSPQTRHIPVHIMSSHEVKNESLLKGAVDFINKPFAFDQMPDIFKKIEYVLTHHPKKVLIVEENAKHAKALAYFLETFDITLDIKNQVTEAIDALKDNGVDCVILDMGIPDQRAYDTLDAVKKTPGLENLPIIIFTGKSLSNTEELRIKQYADSIVVKTAHSYKRIIDEVSLFLHLMEKNGETAAAPKYPKLGALDEVLKNKTVLIADDDMRNIFSLTKALEKYQMNVLAAVDGRDALQKLKKHPDVDIVLMDMMMPEMDGYETTRAIRKEGRYKDLPVIAVTAKAMMGDREKCISAGASDYITKPVDIDQLFSLLRVWLYESGRR